MVFENCDNMELMARYEDNHFDLAIVDPPYGIERFKKGIGKNERHTVKTTSLLWNNNTPTEAYFDELFRVSKNQIIWGANNFILPPTEYFCCWNKEQTVSNFATLEYAWVSMGLKKPAKLFTYTWNGMLQGDMKNKEIKIHPTQKPVALYKWLLSNYAKAGDLILDTHVGSASSLIACEQMGFDYVGCELDPEYYEKACKRIKEETAQADMFI